MKERVCVCVCVCVYVCVCVCDDVTNSKLDDILPLKGLTD